jgi:hypothetical protein
MTRCPHCRQEIELSAGGSADLVEFPDQDWVPVARLADAAEAAYFCDVLEQRDIAAFLVPSDQINALDGGWSTSYVIKVPANARQRATDVLREEVAETDDAGSLRSDAFESGGRPSSARTANAGRSPAARSPVGDADATFAGESMLPGLWKGGLVVGLLASGLAVMGLRGCDVRPGIADPTPASENPLCRALGETPGALVSTQGRRLSYDATDDRFVLEEDFDGDGIYDRRREFLSDGRRFD